MAIILDGKKLSQKILEEVKKKIAGRKLKMAAILVGDDENSKIFLRQKEKACKFVGVEFRLYKFLKDISQDELAERVREIAKEDNQGIIIQLPLPARIGYAKSVAGGPKHIDTQEILNLIPPEKDIDALSEKSENSPILSPVLYGILKLFKQYKINFKNKKIVVVGRGILVGRPIIKWLEKQHIDISDDIKKADVIISGVGKPGFTITGDMVKKGAVVVDAAGDVDFKTVAPKAGFITPVPGGVGPMTVACLIDNLVSMAKIQRAVN